MAKPEKIAIVDKIRKDFKESQNIVLTNYRGLSVHELANLRRKLRENDCQYRVYKNTLVRIITKEIGLESLDSYLIGPTGIAFAKGDFLSFLKALNEISKKYECFEAKAGLVDGEILDASKLKILANLPSREELIAKLVGTLKSPLSNVVNTLVSPIRGLVYLLNSAAQQK